MTDIQIPAAMIEAGARAYVRHRAQVGGDPADAWDEPPVPPSMHEAWRESQRQAASAVLAGALEVCDVHEESRSVFADGEWSVWMPPGDFSHWRRWRASFREMEPVAWDEHRLSIITPAEQVDTEGAPK